MGASECKPCKPADEVPTVKVDPTLLTNPQPLDGMKAQVLQEDSTGLKSEEQQRQEAERLEEEKRRDEEKRLEEERRLQEQQAEQERLQEEERQRQQQAEEEARRQADEEAEERRKLEEAERARAEEEERAQAAAEVERKKAEEAREAARLKAEMEDLKKKAEEFLKARGFKSALVPRKAFCGATVYALHLAVEENNAETVRALVRSGADLNQKNAAGKTARELAEKFNKNGSHKAALDALTR